MRIRGNLLLIITILLFLAFMYFSSPEATGIDYAARALTLRRGARST